MRDATRINSWNAASRAPLARLRAQRSGHLQPNNPKTYRGMARQRARNPAV